MSKDRIQKLAEAVNEALIDALPQSFKAVCHRAIAAGQTPDEVWEAVRESILRWRRKGHNAPLAEEAMRVFCSQLGGKEYTI